MKRVIALLLALVLVFAMAACGNKTDDTKTPNTPAPGQTDAPSNGGDATEPTEAPAEPAATWPNGDITILAGYAVGSLRMSTSTPSPTGSPRRPAPRSSWRTTTWAAAPTWPRSW